MDAWNFGLGWGAEKDNMISNNDRNDYYGKCCVLHSHQTFKVMLKSVTAMKITVKWVTLWEWKSFFKTLLLIF